MTMASPIRGMAPQRRHTDEAEDRQPQLPALDPVDADQGGDLEKAHSRGDRKQSTDQHHQGDAVHVAVEDRLEEKLVTKPSRPSPPECRRRPRRPPWRQGPRPATGPGGLRDDDAENDSRHEGSGPGPGCSSGQTEGRRGAARWWRRARKCRAGPAPPHRRIPTGTSTSPAAMSRASHPARERGGTATPATGAASPSGSAFPGSLMFRPA